MGRTLIRLAVILSLSAVAECLFTLRPPIWLPSGIVSAARPMWPDAGAAVVGAGALISAAWSFSGLPSKPVTFKRAPLRAEIALIVLFLGGFTWLSLSDAGSWYYSATGDEYAFFTFARDIGKGLSVNAFSQTGVYGEQPVLDSLMAGQLMRLFGYNVIGWRAATLIPVLAALLAAYFATRTMFGERIALLTLGLMSTAHYLLGFDHIGYNNLDALFPASASVLFAALWLRGRRPWWLVPAGLFAGLGWYTYYTSRVMIGVLAACIMLTARNRRWPLVWTLGAWALAVTPLFVVNKGAVVAQMLSLSSANKSERVANRDMLHVWNLGRSLLAFNYNVTNSHFVSGSLVEPATGVLMVLGTAWAIKHWSDPRFRLLLLWMSFGLIAAGVFSPYDSIAITRLNFLLPPIAIAAAVGMDVLVRATREALTEVAFSYELGVGAVLLLATFGNLHRWFIETPANVPTTPESVAIRVMETPICRQSPLPPLLVQDGPGGLIGPAVSALPWLRPPAFGGYTDTGWMQTVAERCTIVAFPEDASAGAVLVRLGKPVDEHDRSGRVTVDVYFPPLNRFLNHRQRHAERHQAQRPR